jgi:hypothetical protein
LQRFPVSILSPRIMFFGLFGKNPQREARRLNKDAATVVEMARVTYRGEILREIARITREGIEQLHALDDADEDRRQHGLGRFKALHRESRQGRDQAGLTAYTLVIIYATGLEYGDATAASREAIQDFVDEWPAERREPRTLEG